MVDLRMKYLCKYNSKSIFYHSSHLYLILFRHKCDTKGCSREYNFMCSEHQTRICNTCWTGIHTNCSVHMLCSSEDLEQDLNILKKHLEMMQYYTLVSDVSTLVDNFTASLESLSNNIATIESEVTSVINNNNKKEYNNMKDRIHK